MATLSTHGIGFFDPKRQVPMRLVQGREKFLKYTASVYENNTTSGIIQYANFFFCDLLIRPVSRCLSFSKKAVTSYLRDIAFVVTSIGDLWAARELVSREKTRQKTKYSGGIMDGLEAANSCDTLHSITTSGLDCPADRTEETAAQSRGRLFACGNMRDSRSEAETVSKRAFEKALEEVSRQPILESKRKRTVQGPKRRPLSASARRAAVEKRDLDLSRWDEASSGVLSEKIVQKDR